MTAYELARAIHARHRAARRNPGPRWEELTLRERQAKTEQARRLQVAYARTEAPEVAIAETTEPATYR